MKYILAYKSKNTENIPETTSCQITGAGKFNGFYTSIVDIDKITADDIVISPLPNAKVFVKDDTYSINYQYFPQGMNPMDSLNNTFEWYIMEGNNTDFIAAGGITCTSTEQAVEIIKKGPWDSAVKWVYHDHGSLNNTCVVTKI